MKKYYVSEIFKRRNNARIIREEKRRVIWKEKRRKRRAQEQLINATKRKDPPHYRLGGKNKQEAILVAPKVFSVVENTEDMAEFFREFHDATEEATQGLSIDMSGVTKITGDAVIYMISMFERFRIEHPSKYGVKGNVPKDEECRKRLFQLGFQKFVRFSSKPTDPPSDKFIEMMTGSNADGSLVIKILEFTRKHLKVDTNYIYQTVVECMANTNNHAFRPNEAHPFWYVTVEFDSQKEELCFYFLDSGLGIPRTVRKSFREKIRQVFPEPYSPSDLDLIISALDGKFRTRTGDETRGQGLPAIYQYFNDKHIEDLVIVSQKARVDPAGKNIVIQNPFYGTLISWKLKKG